MWKCLGVAGLISALIANDLYAGWNITMPTANTVYAPGSPVGGSGTTTESSANFTLSVIDGNMVVWSQQTGTSTIGILGASSWNATCANPTGGFPKGTTQNLVVKSTPTGDSATVQIKIANIP